jgi:hypothetical protein
MAGAALAAVWADGRVMVDQRAALTVNDNDRD